jgi:hypothetical protein
VRNVYDAAVIKVGARNAASYTAQWFRRPDGMPYSAARIRQIVKQTPQAPPEPIVDYVNQSASGHANAQAHQRYDALLVRLILTNHTERRDIITTTRRRTELRWCVWMVLYATCITVLGSVALPPAGLVFVPLWALLLRELSAVLAAARVGEIEPTP